MNITEMLKNAREIVKKMGNARFIVNHDYEEFTVSYYISDGENTIAADTFDGYFMVNGTKCDLPITKRWIHSVFSIADGFAKKHDYEYGLNPIQ